MTDVIDFKTINFLANKLQNAKLAEEVAKNNRIRVEDEIIELIGEKHSGKLSISSDIYRLSTTGNVKLTINDNMFNKLKNSMPSTLKACFTTTYKLDKRRFNEICEYESHKPFINQVITETRNKTSVKVERI